MANAGAIFSGIGGGAAAGAGLGSAIPGIGTALGGLGGAIFGGLEGLFGGNAAEEAAARQKAAIDQAMQRLQAFSQESYKNRMQDLHQTLGFYKPTDNYLRSIYGGAPTATMNRLPPTAGPAGTWNGVK